MNLTELYRQLGSLIKIRGKIRKDIIELQQNSEGKSLCCIKALEEEQDNVQEQILEIDRQIRQQENARVLRMEAKYE